jgi:hypothetical protein
MGMEVRVLLKPPFAEAFTRYTKERYRGGIYTEKSDVL